MKSRESIERRLSGVGPFLENFSRRFNSIMKAIFKKQLLVQNVQMDGSINFQTNGDINVYPCPWESDKQVTNGERVRYETKALYQEEADQIMSYFKTRKEETLWNSK